MPVSWPVPRPQTALEIAKQFRGLSPFFGLFDFKKNHVAIDSLLMTLHCKVTAFILLIGTLFLTMRQYFGDPIECMSSRTDVQPATVQHFCWLEGTFSVAGASTGIPGIQVAYPGVKMLDPSKGERRVYHKYYQWVYFILVIQGILFYVPRYIWKKKEDKRLGSLIHDLRKSNINEFKDYDRKKLVQDVADNLLISNEYYFWYVCCEVLCLFHLIAEFWFTNMLLNGSFLGLGQEWIYYAHSNEDNTQDPLIRIFPRMAKCTFHKFGFSGSIEPIDALCFLPLNIINEKLFVILWFWYVFLICLTFIMLFSRLITYCVRPLRFRFLKSLAPSTDKKYIKCLTSRPGNWFVLKHIAKFMKPSHFRDLVDLVMKEHFDPNGKPVYSTKSKLSKAITNGLQGVSKKSKDTKSPPKKEKNKLDSVKITTPTAPGFIYETRDPPSGNSADESWGQEEWSPLSTTNNDQGYENNYDQNNDYDNSQPYAPPAEDNDWDTPGTTDWP